MEREFVLLNRICAVIGEEIHKDVAFPQLRIFLMVCRNQGITQTELSKNLNMPQATVSRNVIKLGNLMVQDSKGHWKQKGYGLVEARPDIDESRRNAVYLTKKGAKVADKIAQAIKKGVKDLADQAK